MKKFPVVFRGKFVEKILGESLEQFSENSWGSFMEKTKKKTSQNTQTNYNSFI